MKKLLKIIILCLTINSALAAKLEDVVVLDITQGKENVELKLQAKNGPKDSYFIVDVVKNDKDAFDKLAIVLKKLKNRDNFKLSLNIPSFSIAPSGSYYRSDSVTFLGSTLGSNLFTMAAPAAPGVFYLAQPNGIKIGVQSIGDEHWSWMETNEGYTIEKATDGFWYFVSDKSTSSGPVALDKKNKFTLTNVQAHLPPPANLPKRIRPSGLINN